MNIIKELRLKNKMTIQEVANSVGVARVTVTKWENGDRKVNKTYIPILADIFNIDKSILYEELYPRLYFNTKLKKEELVELKRLKQKYENIVKHIDYLIEEIS